MKRKNIIRLSCMVLALFVSTICFSLPAYATTLSSDHFVANRITASFDQNTSYNGFSLEWAIGSQYALLKSITSETSHTEYNYNPEEQRISKVVDGITTSFSYGTSGIERGKIVYENRNGVEIYYTYSLAESISNFIQPYSFEIDGVKYFYEFDGGITVTGLKNEANELVFRYEYEKGLVSKIFQKNCEGTWEDVTNDKYTAGHINRLRYCGYYFDEETQWYYCGRLYDPTSESFVDYGLVSPIASAYAVSGDVPAAVFNQAFIFYENCMSNTSFGRPIESYSSTWFSGLSEIEVLARTIYGENTYSDRHNDRQAVGWIIVNRYNNERFEDTIGGVCTEAAQFESVTGNEARTANARCPSTTSAAWSEAVSIASNIMACKSYGSNFTAYLEGLMPRPDGITDQLFFVGLEWFKVASTDGTSGLKYNFGTAAGHVDISKVVVVDVDTNITSKAELNNIASPYKYNVFFYYSP